MSIIPDIIVYNATILTLDDKDTFHYPGTIAIKNGKIINIFEGSPAEVDLPTEAIVIDGTDKLVMPGLVDLHFHTSVAKVRILIGLMLGGLL